MVVAQTASESITRSEARLGSRGWVKKQRRDWPGWSVGLTLHWPRWSVGFTPLHQTELRASLMAETSFRSLWKDSSRQKMTWECTPTPSRACIISVRPMTRGYRWNTTNCHTNENVDTFCIGCTFRDLLIFYIQDFFRTKEFLHHLMYPQNLSCDEKHFFYRKFNVGTFSSITHSYASRNIAKLLYSRPYLYAP